MEHGNLATDRTAESSCLRNRWHPLGWLPGTWKTLAGLLAAALLGFAAFPILHKSIPAAPITASASPRETTPPRPAYTAAEEAYMKALWPIHGEVEVGSARMSLGQIFYMTHDLGQAELKGRADEAIATFRRAEKSLRALRPPQSFQKRHEEYLAAVHLFQASTAEVLKMFKDGNEDHLRAAYPSFQRANDKIRDVGGDFWPDEFPPN